MVRRGLTPSALRMRAASITTALPAALSVAPVPVCQESRWAPAMHELVPLVGAGDLGHGVVGLGVVVV